MSDKRPEKPAAPAPAPVPPGVGAQLRQRRQMRGQSLESVHQATRIPRHLLQALEEDKSSEFAAPVYLRGFLKTYCDHLDLDFDPLWAQLSPAPAAEPTAEEAPRREMKALAAPSVAPVVVVGGVLAVGLGMWAVTRLTRPASRETPPARVDPAALPGLAPGATAAAAVPEPSAPAAPAAPVPAAPAPAAPVPAAPAPGPVAGPELPPAEPTYPARLRVTSTARGFVRLIRDGRLVFEGSLPPGRYLDWRGTTFILHASNPKGLRVELAGRPVDLGALKPGPEGELRIGKK